MIKAIGFDIGGTLIKPSKIYNKSLVEIISDVTNSDKEEVKKIVWKYFVENKNDTNLLFSLYPQIKQEWYIRQKSKKDRILFPEVFEVLKFLKEKGYKMFTISNDYCWNEQLDTTISDFFDEEIYSYEVGFSKPSEEIFVYVEYKMGIKGREVLYVGDSIKSDIEGPKKRGWNTVLVNRNNRFIVENNKEINYVINSLLEIKEIIEIKNIEDFYNV